MNDLYMDDESVKNNRIITYNIANIYIGKYINNLVLLLLKDNDKFAPIKNGFGGHSFLISNFNQIENIMPISEYLQNHGLSILLCNNEGCYNTRVSFDKLNIILQILNKLSRMSTYERERLSRISDIATYQATDLLGINVHDNPSSNLNLPMRKSVIVKSKKALLFQQNLSKFIFSDLINEGYTILINDADGRDKNINRSLKISDIKITNELLENQFCLKVSNNGNLELSKPMTKQYKL